MTALIPKGENERPTLPQLRTTDTLTARKALQWLDAISAPRHLTFQDIRAFTRRHKAILLGTIFDASWFLPLSTPPGKVRAAIRRLHPPPTPNPELQSLLGQLWLVTKHQKIDDNMRDQTLEAYYRRLITHSPDVVLAVLENKLRTAKFFPSLAELEDSILPLCESTTRLSKMLELSLPTLISERKKNDP